ncbi:MAG: hypothetical protein PF638_14955 [Candidatus Delongbacteria bacterium]|jgi:hypothetical protein|nr:hypothetical protein [Candidatus Delongbacteria bacterium]
MKILEKLKNLDRRIIYLLVFLSIIIPLMPGFDFLKFPVSASKETKAIFDQIEDLNEGDAVHIDFAFTPTQKAELLPFFEAFYKHCLLKKIKVFIYYAASVNGIGLGKETVKRIMQRPEFSDLVEGVDFIQMDYIPIMPDIQIFSMVSDYKGTFKKQGKIFEGVETLDDIDYILGISGSKWHNTFIDMQIRFHYKFAMAVTAVTGPDYIPYYQTGQLCGLSNGLRGAAEYEMLVSKKYDVNYYGTATKGLSSLTFSHLMIFGLIFLGNIVYFYDRKKGGK